MSQFSRGCPQLQITDGSFLRTDHGEENRPNIDLTLEFCVANMGNAGFFSGLCNSMYLSSLLKVRAMLGF